MATPNRDDFLQRKTEIKTVREKCIISLNFSLNNFECNNKYVCMYVYAFVITCEVCLPTLHK